MGFRQQLNVLTLGLLWFVSQLAWSQSGVPVAVTEVSRSPVYRELSLNGTVVALRNARLSPAISGLVQSLSVDAGSRVETGDILLKLDPELAELQLRSARARAQQLQQALADAKRRLREARELAPQRSIAESVVRDLEAEVAEDTAALLEAQAEAEHREALLARHILRAPFEGVVSARQTEMGEWVDPGDAVMLLVGTKALRLDFRVAEDYLGAVEPGREVNYRLSGFPAVSHVGTVETVVPVTDPGARTFLMRIMHSEANTLLSPGMSVQATIQIPAGREELVVPRDAILRYPDGRTVVWTVTSEGNQTLVRENLVQIGVQFGGLIEIVSGLNAGTRVVIKGNEALQNNQTVRILPTTAEQG